MKVLMITTSYPDHEGSNRGIFIRRLCRELVKKGVEIIILTPRVFKQSFLFEEEKGIRIHRFRYPSSDTPLNQLGSIPVLAMTVYMLSGFFKSLYLILKEKPDIIHGNWIVPTGLIASLSGFFTGTPVINTARGMDMRVSERGLIRFLFNLAVKLSDKVTVVSESMRDRALLSDAEIISSGVNEAFFKIKPDYEPRIIISLRSLEKIYDVETLLRAIPYLTQDISDLKCIIAGTGSHESALKEAASTLGIMDYVHFIGSVPHKDVVEFMKNASVYISTATADGTSIALLEAISAGLIPVVTDIEANRSLVSDGYDGYLFRPGDEKDLAAKILLALSARISQEVLEKKRLSFKSMICWSSVANRFIRSYTQLTERFDR